MKASLMHRGQTLVVTAGPLAGTLVEVINPVVIPDGLPNQRKVEVRTVDSPDSIYLLPKVLDTPDRQFKPVATAALTPQPFTVIDGGGESVGIPDGIVGQQQAVITDPMDPALDRFRPDASIVDQYVARTMPNGMTDWEFLLALAGERNVHGNIDNLALVGETQAGKTMLVRVLAVKLAERLGYAKPLPVFTLNGSVGITTYDLYGQPSAVTINGREVIVWMDGLIPMAVSLDAAIVYLDEWNAVPPAQAVALHPLLDDRREFTNYKKAVPNGHGGWRPEVTRANQNLWVITTVNPGYKGTQTMAEASINRFRWITWDYDETVEKALIPSDTVRALGRALREARANRALTTPTGTSALQRLTADLANFGADMAVFMLMSSFPPVEHERVMTIVTDRGFMDLLRAEYPNPKHGKKVEPVDNGPF